VKFSADISDLAPVLVALAELSDRKATGSAMSGMLVVAEGAAISVTTTDFAMQLTRSFPAAVAVAGGAVLPAGEFADIVKALPKDAKLSIDTTAADGRAILTCNRSRYKLPIRPSSGYPAYRRYDEPEPVELDAAALLGAIDCVEPAVCRTIARPMLESVFLHDTDGCVRLVATDGARLHAAEFPGSLTGIPDLLIPAKAIEHLRRLAKAAGDEPIRLTATRTYLCASGGRTRFISPLMRDTFPDYRFALAVAPTTQVTFDTKQLEQALRRVNAIGDDKARTVTFGITSAGAHLSARERGGVEVEDDVPVVALHGPEIRISLGAHYLLAALRALDAEQVLVDLTTPDNLTVWRPTESDARFAVVMPRRDT
jgi:DNA polymerase-3 subunit beta